MDFTIDLLFISLQAGLSYTEFLDTQFYIIMKIVDKYVQFETDKNEKSNKKNGVRDGTPEEAKMYL